MVSISAGRSGACGVLDDGGVACWGAYDAYLARLSDSDSSQRLNLFPWRPPYPILAVAVRTEPAARVSGGQYTLCVTGVDGRVLCRGDNWHASLGLGEMGSVEDLTDLPSLRGAADVVMGGTLGVRVLCGLMPEGAVLCAGSNAEGLLGVGSAEMDVRRHAPVRGLPPAAQLSIGDVHACAVDAAGAVWCWGKNDTLQLGRMDVPQSASPAAVRGVEGATAVAACERHSCALLRDRTVVCWGDGATGQLGDGARGPAGGPRPVVGLVDVRQLACGDQHTCALRGDGTVACWGANGWGQATPDGADVVPSPADVAGLSGARQITCGDQFSCAVRGDGSVLCWGDVDKYLVGSDPSQRQPDRPDVARVVRILR